jgi:ribosomal protein L40E
MIKLGYRNKVAFATRIEDYKGVESLEIIPTIEEVLTSVTGSKDMAIFDAGDNDPITTDIIKQLPYKTCVAFMPTLEGVTHNDNSNPMLLGGKEYTLGKRYYNVSTTSDIIIKDDMNNFIAHEIQQGDKRLLVLGLDVKKLMPTEFNEVMKYVLSQYICKLVGANSIEEIAKQLEEVRFNAIVNSFAESSTKDAERKIIETKRQLNNAIADINSYKESIITKSKAIETYKMQLVGYESADVGAMREKIVKEFNAMKANPKILNVRIENEDVVTFETPQIFAYDQHGNRYALNRYKVKMNFKNGSVRYFGLDPSLCKNGCWTQEDPHPHVNGGSGEPCLGSIASTMAQLISDKEIYALSTIAINYLESVNTDDYAGKKVKNWECVDEDGNKIQHPLKQNSECYVCGDDDEDDLNTCYECGRRVCSDHRTYVSDEYVCDNCIESNDNYKECQHTNEYYHVDEMGQCAETNNWYHEDYLYELDDKMYYKEVFERLVEEKKFEPTPVPQFTTHTVEDTRPVCKICGSRINPTDATTCLDCFDTIHIGCSQTRGGMTFCPNH